MKNTQPFQTSEKAGTVLMAIGLFILTLLTVYYPKGAGFFWLYTLLMFLGAFLYSNRKFPGEVEKQQCWPPSKWPLLSKRFAYAAAVWWLTALFFTLLRILWSKI